MFCARKTSVLTTSVASVNTEAGIDDKQPSNSTEDFELNPAEMSYVTISVNRGPDGYGFSVTNGNPCVVSRIEKGSTADQAGLEKHDCIMHINRQNVSHLDVYAVVAIVKKCERHMFIDVIRGDNPQDAYHVARDMCAMTSLAHAQTSTQCTARDAYYDFDTSSLDDSCISDVTSYDTSREPSVLSPWKRLQHVSPWELYRQLKQKQAILADNDMYESQSEFSSYANSESDFSCSTISLPGKENAVPYEAKLARLCRQPDDVSRECVRIIHNTSKPTQNLPASDRTETTQMRFSTFLDNACSAVSIKQKSLRDNTRVDSKRLDNTRLDSTHLDNTSDRSRLSEDSGIEVTSALPISYHSLSNDESKRQQLIAQLYRDEVTFRNDLRHGIQQYVQPLDVGIVTQEQHEILFQNIEQLYDMSYGILRKMQSNFKQYADSSNEHYLDNLGAILSNQIDQLCVAYEKYGGGIKHSMTLLMELRKIKDFDRFLKKLQYQSQNQQQQQQQTQEQQQQQQQQLKLSSVIQRPVAHIKNMTVAMQKIYKLTDAEHSDYENMQEVVRALRKCSTNISQEFIRQSQTNLTTMTSSSTTLHDTASSDVSSSSVDSEVQELQNRLVFPSDVDAFQLVNSTRHVIYSGDLEYMTRLRHKMVHVVLLNDVILITERGSNESLTALERPILLKDVSHCTGSNRQHPSEFQIKVECHHCETLGIEPKYFSFRAASLEQKCVWKNLLQQRVNFIKMQRQFTHQTSSVSSR